MLTVNHQIILRARPIGFPDASTFAAREVALVSPQDGEVVLDTLYVSVDPAMRVWIGDNPGYVEPVGIGEVMRAGGIGRVVESRFDGLEPGDVVQGRLGWQSRPTLSGQPLQKLDLDLGSVLDWIGPLGGTGLTAYFGFFDVGQAKPDDVVLVSAAAGGVGQMVCQLSKIHGCRTIGIAGGPEKCAFISETFGLDGVIDYKATADLDSAVKALSPDGLDLYFDNVGGPTLDVALQNLRLGGRVSLCGRISQTASTGELYGVRNTGLLIGKRARIAGFIVTDFSERFTAARQWLSEHVKAGRITQRLHILDGLEQAPEGLQMLFMGANNGKLVIKVGEV